MKHYIFYGDANLGDTALAVMALKKFVTSFEDVYVSMFCRNSAYVKELENLFVHPRYTFSYCSERPDNSILTWVGNPDGGRTYHNRMSMYNNNFIRCVMEYMDDIFQQLGYSRILNGDIKSFKFDFESISNSLWRNKQDIDILLVNSVPMSGQTDYDESAFVDFINRHKYSFNIATTKHIDGMDIFCTEDYGMTLSDIGALAINIPIVVGVNTSPILFIANKWAIDKQWCICVRGRTNCVFGDGGINFLASTTELKQFSVSIQNV